MNFIKTAAASLAAALLFTQASQAAPVTIDFNGSVGGNSYQEDGFNVAGNLLATSSGFGTPAPSLVLDELTTEITLTSVDGSAFDLISFVGLCLIQFNKTCPTTIGFSGVGSDGSSVGLTLAAIGSNFTTVSPTSFANMASVSFFFDSQNASGTLIDSIVVEASPIPLPASFGFLAAGIGGLAFLRRKRKAAT